MKIFITGVAGFLGSHLADLMLSQGHTVAGNDNMIGGYADNVPQDVEFHQVDCCDLENLTKAMGELELELKEHQKTNNSDEKYPKSSSLLAPNKDASETDK